MHKYTALQDRLALKAHREKLAQKGRKVKQALKVQKEMQGE